MSNALATIAQSTGTSPEEIKEVISGMIISAKAQHGAKASDGELAVVAGVCATYGLNPLVKEAHAFISGGKLQVMIGIHASLLQPQDLPGMHFDHHQSSQLAAQTHVPGGDQCCGARLQR